MIKFLLFAILCVICWPCAIVALIVYPFVWLMLLPFRLIGVVVTGVFSLVGAIFSLPARLIKAI
jgi:hypothetical protein